MEQCEVAVMGGGPAGLMAAETAARAGVRVALFDAMPSVGRKLLVAGRGGLNLTHGGPLESFVAKYSGSDLPDGFFARLIAGFPPAAAREWAAGLGIETFEQRTGRVYPREMKAAPLLRRWIMRLKDSSVMFHMNHKWSGLERCDGGWRLGFDNGREVIARSVVFAFGGGSWPRTGSDGNWMTLFRQMGIECTDLQPANCGWETDWPQEVLEVAEGEPLKNLRVRAGNSVVDGELLLTRYGLEGGAIYALGAELRAMAVPAITIDFKPTFSEEQLIAKLAAGNLLAAAQRSWKLASVAVAMLATREWSSAAELAHAVKNRPVVFNGPRPIAEAISSAGGVRWSELDDALMLRKFPGVFVSGEMIDWDAPTGGYLMQACLATGRLAGRGAAACRK